MLIVTMHSERPVGSPGFLDLLSFKDPSGGFKVEINSSGAMLRKLVPESVADFDAALVADGMHSAAWSSAKSRVAALFPTKTAAEQLDLLVEATKRAVTGE